MNGNVPIRGIAAVIIALAALMLLRGIIFTVDERELAVVLEFGRPVASITEPGLNYKKPLIQEVQRLPRTRQFWQSGQGDKLVDLPSKDGKKIEVSAWAIWRIVDPEKFVRVLRTVDNGEQAVRVRVRSVVRDVITSYNLAEVVRSTDRQLTRSFGFANAARDRDSDDAATAGIALTEPDDVESIRVGRKRMLAEIKEKIQLRLKGGDGDNANEASGESVDRGVELVDVGIYDIAFVPEVQQAAFARLRAYMESIAAGYENAGVQRKQEILNQTQAEREEILGEGEEQSNILRGNVDAEIIEKYATAIKETGRFYNFIKTLEVYGQALGSDTRLILTTDSELFRLLKAIEQGEDIPAPARE